MKDDFGICASQELRPVQFQVDYMTCPRPISDLCMEGCGTIRYTIKLQRDGATISSRTFTASSTWFLTTFSNVTPLPGVYKATIQIERRAFLCIAGWRTIATVSTNPITVGYTNATPDFNIDGTPITSNEHYVTSCINNIRVNAASTHCEKRYFLGVEECDRWWNRTYQYEWGLWFNGEAPDNINLQAMAATYSTPPYHYIGDPSRQGQILIGGNLPSGQPRYYRVHICTDIPSWQCKTALLRINENCRLSALSPDDTNEYVVWTEQDDLPETLIENISTSVEIKEEGKLPNIEQEIPFNIDISPNPFNTSTTISINNDMNNATIIFELYNSIGERVESIQTTENQFELHRNQLSTGVYMYRVIGNDELLGSGKVIIQ